MIAEERKTHHPLVISDMHVIIPAVFEEVMEEEDGNVFSLVCCAVRHITHCTVTHILYSPADVLVGGRDDDTSWGD